MFIESMQSTINDPTGVASIVFLMVYFVPTLIALLRGHKNSGPILLVNLILGLTLVGWFVALVWCLSSNTRSNERAILVRQLDMYTRFLSKTTKGIESNSVSNAKIGDDAIRGVNDEIPGLDRRDANRADRLVGNNP